MTIDHGIRRKLCEPVAPRVMRFRQKFLAHVGAVFHGEYVDGDCLQLNWSRKSLSSFTTGHLALISLVLRYFAVLHLARSILGLTYSHDLATLRNF